MTKHENQDDRLCLVFQNRVTSTKSIYNEICRHITTTSLYRWQRRHLPVITVAFQTAVGEAVDSGLVVGHHHHVGALCVATQLCAGSQAPSSPPALHPSGGGGRSGNWRLLGRHRAFPPAAVAKQFI